jgi:hypothetical protein
MNKAFLFNLPIGFYGVVFPKCGHGVASDERFLRRAQSLEPLAIVDDRKLQQSGWEIRK